MNEKIVGILDYGMGNLTSVKNTFDFLKIKSVFIEQASQFDEISHLIIPGVGAFPYAMESILEKKMFEPIVNFANDGKPVLGICLGMQLLASKSDEMTLTDGLNLIPGHVKMLQTSHPIPHMGWNGINTIHPHPILRGVKNNADVYFVHSFYFETTDSENVVAETDYGVNFPSIVANEAGNVIGIQFHPEKSQKQGLRILSNFVGL